MEERRIYTQEFKAEAVALSHSSDKPAAQIARELGIKPKLLYRWRAESAEQGADAFPGQGKRTGLEAENAQLRQELARLQQEREILKKALAIFSRSG